jgi:hypothetical protein
VLTLRSGDLAEDDLKTLDAHFAADDEMEGTKVEEQVDLEVPLKRETRVVVSTRTRKKSSKASEVGLTDGAKINHWKADETDGRQVGQFQPTKSLWRQHASSPFNPNTVYLSMASDGQATEVHLLRVGRYRQKKKSSASTSPPLRRAVVYRTRPHDWNYKTSEWTPRTGSWSPLQLINAMEVFNTYTICVSIVCIIILSCTNSLTNLRSRPGVRRLRCLRHPKVRDSRHFE